MTQPHIDQLVQISPTYTAEVDIAEDYRRPEINTQKVQGYIPTGPSRLALVSIIQGLMPVSDKRVHLVTGQYGTGKSHFGLVLANLFGCASGDPLLAPLFAKLRDRDAQAAKDIEARRAALPGRFLVVFVRPTTDPEGFNHSLLMALKDGLDRQQIPYDLRTRFTAAASLVEEWGHDPDWRPRLERELPRQRTDARRLALSLRDLNSEAYDQFQSLYKSIVHTDFHPEHFGVPKEVYLEAVQDLRRERQMAGILLVADEFGPYLSEMARDPSGRAAADIQDFVQFCKRTREDQIHLVVIAHRTLADYAAGYRSRDDFAKLAGRFLGSEYSLTMAGGQTETIDMIDSVILPRRDSPDQTHLWAKVERALQPWEEWAQDQRLFPGQSTSWTRDRLVRGCYPLHPAAAFCLPWLSQRAGQANRTTFKFLDSADPGGLCAFIRDTPAEAEHGGLNLYTPDRFLAYFHAGIEERPEYRAILLARDDARAGSPHAPLAERLIDSLAVLEIVQQPALPRNRSVLAALVGRTAAEQEEADRMLDLLVQQRVIRYRDANDQYELRRRASGEIDVYEAIQIVREEQARRGDVAVYDLVRQRFFLAAIAAGAYESEYGVPRTASVELVRADHLANLEPYLERIRGWYAPTRRSYEGDALVLVVLAESQSEIEAARMHLDQGTGSRQLIVAIPRQPFGGGEALLDLAAIKQIRGQGLKLQDSPVDPDDLQRTDEDRAAKAFQQWQQYRTADNYAWHYAGNVNASVPSGGEDAFVSTILEAVFDKTPVIRDESLTALGGGRKERKADRLKAIGRLLDTSGFLGLQKTGGYPGDRMLRVALRDTELLEKKADRGQAEEFEVRLEAPARSPLAEIWSYLRRELTTPGEPVRFERLVRKLMEPPYGLGTPLLELLLAAALRTVKDEVAVFFFGQGRRKDPGLVEITAENLPKFIADAPDYAFIFYEIHPEQRQYIQRLILMLGVADDQRQAGGIWDRGKTALLAWFASLPDAARKSTDLGEDALRMAQWLSNSAALPEAKQMLSADLPQRLGVSIDGEWTQQTTRQILDSLKRIVQELEEMPSKRARAAQEKLREIFEAPGATISDVDQAARSWFNRLSQLQREHGFIGQAKPLLQVINQGGDADMRFLKQLPQALMASSFETWTSDRDIELFAERVQRLKLEVESWAPPVRPPVVPPIGPGPQPPVNPPPVLPLPVGPGPKPEPRLRAAQAKLHQALQDLNLTPNEQLQVLKTLLEELTG